MATSTKRKTATRAQKVARRKGAESVRRAYGGPYRYGYDVGFDEGYDRGARFQLRHSRRMRVATMIRDAYRIRGLAGERASMADDARYWGERTLWQHDEFYRRSNALAHYWTMIFPRNDISC